MRASVVGWTAAAMLAYFALPPIFFHVTRVPYPGHVCPVVFITKLGPVIRYLPTVPCVATWIVMLPVVLILPAGLAVRIWYDVRGEPMPKPKLRHRAMTAEEARVMTVMSLSWVMLFLIVIVASPVLYHLGYFR